MAAEERGFFRGGLAHPLKVLLVPACDLFLERKIYQNTDVFVYSPFVPQWRNSADGVATTWRLK